MHPISSSNSQQKSPNAESTKKSTKRYIVGIHQDVLLKVLDFCNVEYTVEESWQESKIIAKINCLWNLQKEIEFIYENGEYVFYISQEEKKELKMIVHKIHGSDLGGGSYTLQKFLFLLCHRYQEIVNNRLTVFCATRWQQRVESRLFFVQIREEEKKLYELEKRRIELIDVLEKLNDLLAKKKEEIKAKEEQILQQREVLNSLRRRMKQEVEWRAKKALTSKENQLLVMQALYDYRSHNILQEVEYRLCQEEEKRVSFSKKEVEQKERILKQKEEKIQKELTQKAEVIKQKQLALLFKQGLVESKNAFIEYKKQQVDEAVFMQAEQRFYDKLALRKRSLELRKKTLILKEKFLKKQLQELKDQYEQLEKEFDSTVFPKLNAINTKEAELKAKAELLKKMEAEINEKLQLQKQKPDSDSKKQEPT